MSAPKFQRLLIPVALWFSATLCIAVGTQLAWSQEEAPQSPGTGQGLLSRFRGGTPKPKDSADESMQDRNWKGGLRVPLQGFNPIQNFTPPWKSKTDPTQTTTPAPIDLQRTFKPSKEPFGPRTNALPRSDFGVDPTATNPTATNPAIIKPNATQIGRAHV